ncbi:hypothetical protein [Flavobacterium aquidurense]|uniref:Uncharacterized protein n=1 Tax=Flavobacterium aquidurense TaxID=362413 RepID=A0A0Q0S6S5_9FLAO|nr:hypothetical protein [Flavobacterium aquidurense]KQB41290.1 hypothetical protein RC62_4667 [Flavobacterium aquidurense]
MKNYDVKGILLEGKKAVIAVALPEPSRDNIYKIFKIYNISDHKENKIVIHFKDSKGEILEWNENVELFKIDLNQAVTNDAIIIDFTKEINVAFHHQNAELNKTPQEIYKLVFDPIVTPDTTGKGTIREGA